MDFESNFLSSFRILFIVIILTSIIFQTWEILSQGKTIKELPLPRGQLVIKKVFFHNKTMLRFNYTNISYEIPFNEKLKNCLSYAEKNNLSGYALTWYLNAPQIYAYTNLTPLIMAPSPDLVYFYPGHSYDTLIYPSFEKKSKVQTIASLFLSNNSDLVYKGLKTFNASYIILTKDDFDFRDSFLFALFQGKFLQARTVLNQSLLLNSNQKNLDFLEKLYQDENCAILHVI
ncbi:MAG: hypothetical protein PWP03_13 [Candidatus Woesearchaeota archaeon]|nr:hypothetical protein [Candidatus Woesearchaeota archaeon]MDN5327375.1 hypothetical protein [Candidatus Woesearchaeota archaeon]